MEARQSAAEFYRIFLKAIIYLFTHLGELKHQFLSFIDRLQWPFA